MTKLTNYELKQAFQKVTTINDEMVNFIGNTIDEEGGVNQGNYKEVRRYLDRLKEASEVLPKKFYTVTRYTAGNVDRPIGFEVFECSEKKINEYMDLLNAFNNPDEFIRMDTWKRDKTQPNRSHSVCRNKRGIIWDY